MSHCDVSLYSLKESGKEEEKDEDEDEDFLPTIPENLLHPLRDGTSKAIAADHNLGVERRKRERSPVERDVADNIVSETVCLTRDNNKNDNDRKDGESLMGLLNFDGFPSPSLFERSYRHESALYDIGVLQDEIGALIVTIDAHGTLRAWRKLPRGVFFMGERQGLFPQSTLKEEVNGTAGYFILTDQFTSSLFAVRVIPSVEAIVGMVNVLVEVRQINPTLITVETRLSFYFSVALRTEVGLTHWKDSVTQRPFLLHHGYQPYLVFFVAEKGEVSNVVLVPCVLERGLHSSGAVALVPCVPLSTASLVVCCQQHRPSGLVVLVDEKGIIDYARVVARPGNEGQTVISLQVVSGAPGRGASDTMLLRKWITFERRQKTGFFTILREATSFSKTGRRMIPLSVCFSPTGNYFVVASVILREGYLCVCSHVFEFSSGAFLCRGEAEEIAAPTLCGGEALQTAFWLMRGAVFDVVVEDAVRKSPHGGAGGVWVFLPEIVWDAPFDRHVWGRRVFVFRAAPSLSEMPTTEISKGVKPNTNSGTLFHMEQMLGSIGNVEKSIRETVGLEDGGVDIHKGVVHHFAVPLTLLRLVVPASQALKNLVMQSPVGSALSQEDVKRLFVVSNNSGFGATGNEEYFGHSDPTFCTASLGGTALLMYTKYESNFGGVGLRTHQNTVTVDETVAENLNVNEVVCGKMLLELHQKRDFDCTDFLQLQMSVRHVMPRDVIATEGKEKKCENDTMAHFQLENTKCDSNAEERRVQHIITAAAGMAAECEQRPIYASLFVDCFGMITVRLLPQFAPKAVKNFVGLAREGFYEGLTFHRVVPGFMIQGGCPLGDGTGGKSVFGGTFEDEGMNVMDFFLYPSVYWLCMANRGPNTNESQFFITLGEPAPWLNGKHTVFGFVVAGKPVVQAIVGTAKGSDDKPVTPVVIQRVIIKEDDELTGL